MNIVAQRLLKLLETRRGEVAEFDQRIDKYRHSLQCATRARAAGESDDYVVMALFHDVFGGFHPTQHGNMVGVVLQPYIGKEALMACFEHPFAIEQLLSGVVQSKAAMASAAYRFATQYDMPSFDPDYSVPPIDRFYATIERVMP